MFFVAIVFFSFCLCSCLKTLKCMAYFTYLILYWEYFVELKQYA